MPILSVQPLTTVEGRDQKKHKAYFSVTLSAAAGQDVTFKYKTESLSKDKAVADQDYTAITDDQAVSVTIPQGQLIAYLPVEIIGNKFLEGDRTFSLIVMEVSGAAIQSRTGGEITAVGTIKDDEVSVTIGNASIMEGSAGKPARDLWFPITLSSPARQDVIITYSTFIDNKSKSAATPGDDLSTPEADYISVVDATVTIPAGWTTSYIPVKIIGDPLVESNETFNVQITDVIGAGLGKGKNQAVGTILDDESTATPAPAQLQLSSVKVVEPGNGSLIMDFAIMLSAPASNTIQIDYRTKDLPAPSQSTQGTPQGTSSNSGTGSTAATPSSTMAAATARKDYIPEKGTLIIRSGETRGDIRVKILADQRQESDEVFNLVLSNARGVALDANNSKSLTLTGTIQDDQNPVISAQATSCLEGSKIKGYSDMVFAITLSDASSSISSVNYATSRNPSSVAGSATPKKDFQPVSGKLVFDPGETLKYIHVPIVADRLGEPSETFNLVLSKPLGADFPMNSAGTSQTSSPITQLTIVGTILDDEPSVIV